MELESQKYSSCSSHWNLQMVTTSSIISLTALITIRRKFVGREALKSAIFCIGMILPHDFLRQTRYSTKSIDNIPNLFDDSVFNQLRIGAMIGILGYFFLNFQYSMLAILAVATGLQAPQDWPPLMGKLLDNITSVRSMWGSFWQQMLRRVSIPF